MSLLQEKVIWLIDDDERDLRAYASALELAIREVTHESLVVKVLLVLTNKKDYLQYFNSVNTISVIIDQRLKESGKVAYTGIELAQYLRPFFPKLPIYILTAYAEDHEAFDGEEWRVEKIFSKGLLGGDIQEQNQIIQPLLRHIDIHQKIVEQREARYVELLTKSFQNELNEDEFFEIENLRNDRTVSILAEETDKYSELREKLQNLEEIATKIASLEKKVLKDGNSSTASRFSPIET